MKTFLKIASIILCLSVILSIPTTTHADDLYFEIVEITNDGNTVYVSFRKDGNLTSKLTLICKGEDDSVLYIGEYSAFDYGYFELSFPIISNDNSQLYTLFIGGDDFSTPVSKSFYLFDDGTPQYVLINGGKTVTEIKSILKNNNPSIYRKGVILSNDENVKTLDTISLFNGDKIVERKVAIMGDINLDGTISANDALLALQHSVNKITISGISFKLADIHRNGIIDSECALKILQFSVNKIDRL